MYTPCPLTLAPYPRPLSLSLSQPRTPPTQLDVPRIMDITPKLHPTLHHPILPSALLFLTAFHHHSQPIAALPHAPRFMDVTPHFPLDFLLLPPFCVPALHTTLQDMNTRPLGRPSQPRSTPFTANSNCRPAQRYMCITPNLCPRPFSLLPLALSPLALDLFALALSPHPP